MKSQDYDQQINTTELENEGNGCRFKQPQLVISFFSLKISTQYFQIKIKFERFPRFRKYTFLRRRRKHIQ